MPFQEKHLLEGELGLTFSLSLLVSLVSTSGKVSGCSGTIFTFVFGGHYLHLQLSILLSLWDFSVGNLNKRELHDS